MSTPSDRICASCGRAFAWRKAWARHWDEVRYCSDACRRRKVRPVDRALQAAILELLGDRQAGATISPSEVARVVAADDGEAWRALTEPARRAARRLVAAGEVELTQRGRVVDPSTCKGPVRIRRRA